MRGCYVVAAAGLPGDQTAQNQIVKRTGYATPSTREDRAHLGKSHRPRREHIEHVHEVGPADEIAQLFAVPPEAHAGI